LTAEHYLHGHRDAVRRVLQVVDDHVRQVGLQPADLGALPRALLLRERALRDVAHDGNDHGTVWLGQRAEADLHWELGPVPAASPQVQAGSHRARGRGDEVLCPEAMVSVAKAVGHQDLDGRPQELGWGVAEDLLGLRVGEHDLPRAVHTEDRVRSRVEQASEALLCSRALGEVAHRRRDARDHPVCRLDRREVDPHGDPGAVFSHPDGLEIPERVPGLQPSEQLTGLLRALGRYDERDPLAHCLFRRVAEHASSIRSRARRLSPARQRIGLDRRVWIIALAITILRRGGADPWRTSGTCTASTG
jgi:hypothetical protein